MDNQQASCDTLLNCAGGFPASSDCVNDWCMCNCADPDNCCGAEPSESCFQSSSNSSSAFESCAYVAGHINSCISATTGFATLSIRDQASCFCFDGSGTYDGYSWDNAATTCYAAMSTQTIWPDDQLNDYLDYYVGACTVYVDTSTLSDLATSSGGASATAASAASILSAGSITATTGTVPPTTTGPTAAAGTPSPRTTASSTNTGAKNGSERSALILGAFLIICCLIAS